MSPLVARQPRAAIRMTPGTARPPELHGVPGRRLVASVLHVRASQKDTGSACNPRSVKLSRYSGLSVASASFGSLCTSVPIAI